MATKKDKDKSSGEDLKGIFRVVLDTNIYVAAYLSESVKSPNKEIIQSWLSGEFTLVFSSFILEEIIEKFNQKSINQNLTIELIANIIALGEEVKITNKDITSMIIEDPDDDQILACAVKGNADYIVTYDPHFDILNGFYQGVTITEALPFLYMIRKQRSPNNNQDEEG